MSLIDAVISAVAPSWGARRAAAQVELERSRLVADRLRGFNAVSRGRRAGSDWTSLAESGPTESAADLATLRLRAREMSRNNPYWVAGKRAVVTQVVGTGIRATAVSSSVRAQKRTQDAWDRWAESKVADVAGRLDWYGIQSLVMGTVVSDGECIVRRMQAGTTLRLQVLGPEYLDASKDGTLLPSGGEIAGGVETDQYGAAVAYHLYRRHPSRGAVGSVRVDASEIAHVFRVDRTSQVRGESWIAPVFTRLSDWDDYEDAELMRQKVSACFGAVYTGVEPEARGGQTYEPLDKLEPGMVEYMPAGTDVKLISPPASAGFRDNYVVACRAIAAGIGITYEALTGDYSSVNFSSGRLAHLRMAANVLDWQLHVMIDLLCDRVWRWFCDLQTLVSVGAESDPFGSTIGVEWTLPSRDVIDPEKETRANTSRVRSGFASWSDVVRESGRDPARLLAQLAEDAKRFDDHKLILDIDPRHVSSQGQGAVNQRDTSNADPATAA